MKLWNDFKKFVMRGNLIDLAVGFTVGAAFSTIAKSLVSDILMPPIGLILGRSDFSDLFLLLREGSGAPAPYVTLAAAQEAGAVTVNYGEFINNVLTFLVVAVAMFLVVRLVSRADELLEEGFGDDKQTPQDPANKKCPYCRTVIPYRASRCPNCTSPLERATGAGPLPQTEE